MPPGSTKVNKRVDAQCLHALLLMVHNKHGSHPHILLGKFTLQLLLQLLQLRVLPLCWLLDVWPRYQLS